MRGLHVPNGFPSTPVQVEKHETIIIAGREERELHLGTKWNIIELQKKDDFRQFASQTQYWANDGVTPLTGHPNHVTSKPLTGYPLQQSLDSCTITQSIKNNKVYVFLFFSFFSINFLNNILC